MTDAALLRYVAERTGMNVAGAQQRRLVRVVERARHDSGMTAAAFLDLLHAQPTAFHELVDDVTVGETYFFRERPQLELARDAVQAGQRARAPGPLRVWSAGCSTGEEAYSLAMLLGPAAPDGVQVLGTDISPAALARAERATYGERALRGLTGGERARWFEPAARTTVRVREPVRRSVRFHVGNLLDGPPRWGAFDVVLCRNVLIYLTPEAIASVAQVLCDALTATGWVLTGLADPPLEADGLERVTTRAGVLYRRSGRPAALPGNGSPGHKATAAAPQPTQPRTDQARELDAAGVQQPVRHDARLTAAAAAPAAPAEITTVSDAQSAVEGAPLDPLLRYRLALLHLERGDLRSAVTVANAAVFLDPTFVVAHLLLGRVYEALHDERRAQRCFRSAAALLEQLPADHPVPHADGETAQSLARVVGTALGAVSASDGTGT